MTMSLTLTSNSAIDSRSSSPYNDRLNLELIREVIGSVNEFILELLGDAESWNALKSRCISMLGIRKHDFLEFSEHSVLSNLYWGIDNIESAIQSESPEERKSRLRSSESMLQVPALLDEEGTVAGIANRYLIGISYFYLSVVQRLQGDDLQVAMHFLMAVSVCPKLIRKVFAPALCELLFPSRRKNVSRRRNGGAGSVYEFDDDEEGSEEAMKQRARKFKGWLMYYQVMLYGETPQRSRGHKGIQSKENKSNRFDAEFCVRTESPDSTENRHSRSLQCDPAKGHPLVPDRYFSDNMDDATEFVNYLEDYEHLREFADSRFDYGYMKRQRDVKCVQDILKEPQSDASNCDSAEGSETAEDMEDAASTTRRTRISVELTETDPNCRKQQGPCSTSDPECKAITTALIERLPSSIRNFNMSLLELRERKQNNGWNLHVEDITSLNTSEQHERQLFNQIAATSWKNHRASQKRKPLARRGSRSSIPKTSMKDSSSLEKASSNDLMGIFEKAVSQLCFSEGLRKLDEENIIQIMTMYETLNGKTGVKHSALKDVLLDQLLKAISTSKEEKEIRMSVSILTTIALANQSVLGDIKRKGLQLSDLASALKRNVHEAAILIYLINPSPSEIKMLGLLPNLVEIVCTRSSYKLEQTSVVLTPPVASLMIIEVLVTAFDNATNGAHLAALNSPQVLHGLLDVARDSGAEESISLATIIVKCMQFDGQCRVYVSQFTPVSPFLSLLQSTMKRAKFVALEFFHEILRMPRSSATSLLQRIRSEGGVDLMPILMLCVQNLELHHQLFAANLLLQLDTLQSSSGKTVFMEEAMKVLLESITREDDPTMHQLSAFILANLGGTYAWTGEPYTVAWLVKKAGLASMHHRNMIKDFDWEDQSLVDPEVDSWCSKIAKNIISMGNLVFQALEKGLKSKTKRVSRDSLTSIAWLGCEIAKNMNTQKYSACEILLGGLEQFLHPGVDLEERLLSCFCIYNYASGKGMQKLVHFSEGVRESLRRFSNVTWMAEELHKVAEFYLPNKSRISCVHTQVLEAGHSSSIAVNALIYYKGLLCSGHSDGSIKMWDIKGQSATLLWERKEHKKEVTCFSLLEQGDFLLSGSADKTIRVWKMVQRKLECSEVIPMKDPIRRVDTLCQLIFAIVPGRGIKVIDTSRTVKEICKSKKVKSMCVIQGKVFAGCKDSSVQEIILANYREREIKAPSKSWMMHKKPITSIISYKDWMYTASTVVEGSNIKEWRRNCEAETRIAAQRGSNVVAMGIVEDFIYLNCSSSTSVLQIWLRGTRQRVGRISAGSKITSLLTANDVVICGTEAGLIKGWIPL